MTIEMHLSGVPEAIFIRDRDADVFMTEYKKWLQDQSQDYIFEFFHNGSIHCFSLHQVVYLKVKMPTEDQTRGRHPGTVPRNLRRKPQAMLGRFDPV